MSAPLCDQDVLKGGTDPTLLPHPMRVLVVVLAEDLAWLIELPRAQPVHPNRFQSYYRGPQKHSLSGLTEAVDSGRLARSTYRPRIGIDKTDQDIRDQALNDNDRDRLDEMLKARDSRWEALLPLITGSKDPRAKRRPFLTIIADTDFPRQVKARAEALGMGVPTLYSWLHQYWANGSRKNGLCDRYWRCGNPGAPKPQANKLGRPSRLYLAKRAGAGFVMDEETRLKLAHGYRLITAERTASDSYHLVSGIFWADRGTGEDGKDQVLLWPADQRPTYSQFMYWGRKLNNDKTVLHMVLGEGRWNQKARSRGGSVQDQMNVVGQLSYFDGTSTDLYVTAMRSRLKTLPPMTRLILQEGRSEIIYGLNCDWEPASPATALLTILHGATSKVEFCRRFDIEITEDDWPSLLALTHQADNGELKAAVISEAEDQFGFSVDYVQARRGDKKGANEASHKTTHSELDHKLPGTTHGKRRERGEDDPASNSLWNYYEYMRELIFSILEFNNKVVLELAPVAMLQEEPDLVPTRLNIFKWLRKKGLTAELPRDVEAIRAFTLPQHQAVVRKNGVHLMAKIHGRLQLIPKLRYTSTDPAFLALISRVKLQGATQETRLRMNSEDLSVAWLPTRHGMIRLNLASRDTLLRDRMTLMDWRAWLEAIKLDEDARRGSGQQRHLVTLLRREATTVTAKREQKAEVAQAPKRPSKKQRKSDMAANREIERMVIRTQLPSAPPVTAPEPAPASTPLPAATQAADRAMREHNEARRARRQGKQPA